MNFTEAAYQYIMNLRAENGKNLIRKKQQLEMHLIPFFKTTPLQQIKRPDIERFKTYMLDKGFAPSTINRYIAVLSQLLHKAVEWDWLTKVPCKNIKFREDNIRTLYLSSSEIIDLVKASEQDRCPIIESFIRIALGTAMRRTEILSIRLEHIDTYNREIYIPKAKCGARMQPMTASLNQYLEPYLRQNTKTNQVFLFPSLNSASGHREEIEAPFRRVVKLAGLDPKKVCRHTLRHTAITHLVQAGVDLPTVQRFSGHRAIQMVFRYAHQSKDHLHQALDKMDQRLSSQ